MAHQEGQQRELLAVEINARLAQHGAMRRAVEPQAAHRQIAAFLRAAAPPAPADGGQPRIQLGMSKGLVR
jgi:hypothetical protein